LIHSYYGQLDDVLGEIVERCGPDTTLFLVSDHGFGPLRKEVYINRWLADQGYLASASLPITARIRGHVRAIAHTLGITEQRLRALVGARGASFVQSLASASRIDWSRTVAYSDASNGIRLNLKGREPHGIVNPGTQYERVRAQISEQLAQLRDPDTGQRVVGTILRREEFARGLHIDRAPDILLRMVDDAYVAYGTEVDVDSVFAPPGWRTGAHTTEGVLLAAGRHVRQRATITGARIIDIAPTILHLMGVPIPEDMDGQVLSQLFEPEFLASNRPATTPVTVTSDHDTGYRWEEKEGEIIKDRLRGLGYVD
jgi:predicted AlkP superfamily phosphohydrolase/phosphomutase